MEYKKAASAAAVQVTDAALSWVLFLSYPLCDSGSSCAQRQS